ncbi:hypothetical protein NAP1_14233 [Erythrobacter sp. NAP1]|uniref:hypothetical protein n=1 Tax=Erythrobacter sp. NAP1 TaxID=237727 RepID=UPI0000687676|nr:hypothetical protein [Erythrobacter sp. NAP1]EAQ28764.1 hypothetical protein NAP1_14233 [Erythrobacter sp. NAP1]
MTEGPNEAVEQFRTTWLPRLNNGAATLLIHVEGEGDIAPHAVIADNFVGEFGYKRIGFNWELLDATPDAHGPRSAEHQLVEALSKDIANPSKQWLPEESARACSKEFLALFDPEDRTVVSNRYDGLWNPISKAPNEWAFVGFDRQLSVLLLITED